jgi:O-antigen biosynthesis protein
MRKKPLYMEFTGERFAPEAHGNIELEHLRRYLQAREISSGKVVLDIASGEGFGSAMLANSANKVMGVDISAEASKARPSAPQEKQS